MIETLLHRTLAATLTLICAVTAHATAGPLTTDSTLVGRPYKQFDVMAYCSYSSFYPSQYLTDNNWDILCAFTTPGTTARLDSLGISHTRSQLRLLEVGDLLRRTNDGIYSTSMHIFDKEQTEAIREESRLFTDSIFPLISPDINKLITAFNAGGHQPQAYSLIFSYLLDSYIWSDTKLPLAKRLSNHGTWDGAYWAMYDKRGQSKIGTNGYGPVKVTWTDDLGYWPGDNLLINLGRHINGSGIVVTDTVLNSTLTKWGLTDTDGNLNVPILHPGSGDEIDRLCDSITLTISDAVKNHCTSFAEKYDIESPLEAEVIFYHEVMWDILATLEANHLITRPEILKGAETGRERFSDIMYIVIQS